jgi:hypothetical protein
VLNVGFIELELIVLLLLNNEFCFSFINDSNSFFNLLYTSSLSLHFLIIGSLILSFIFVFVLFDEFFLMLIF